MSVLCYFGILFDLDAFSISFVMKEVRYKLRPNKKECYVLILLQLPCDKAFMAALGILPLGKSLYPNILPWLVIQTLTCQI